MWYEIKIKTQSEAVEAVYAILYRHGVTGIVTVDANDPIYSDSYEGDWDYFDTTDQQFEYEGALLTCYLETEQIVIITDTIQKQVAALMQFGLNGAPAEVTYQILKEEDWANEWKKYYKPFAITENIIIKPLWEDYTTKVGEIVITMNPGKAFGTGTHETTTMCADLIRKHQKNANTLYDIGCGSGILAIIARALGIKNITGIDIDDKAIESSKENAKLNDFDDIVFLKGDLTDALTARADIIVANIIADAIVLLADKIKPLMHQNTVFIASGILFEKSDSVKAALIRAGFVLLEVVKRGEWVAIVTKAE